MQYLKRTILILMLICVVTVPVCSAVTATETAKEKRLSAWELLRKYAEQQAKVTAPQSEKRVVHFPPDRSLGRLMIQDANADRRIEHFDYRPGGTEWEHLGEATGDVVVPAGKRLGLTVDSAAWKDLSPLANLGPDDLYMLSISGPYDGGQLPDDRCMPHIAHLTGLKVLHLVNTNISAKGMGFIKSLDSLERLSLSKRFTDEGLAEVARLPSLKGLYLKENRLTNAGLAHLGRLTSLEELQLVGGRIGDAGLAHLAKLPSLRYLMLFGKNFSDDGLVHLKNIPSLRILDVGGLGQITDTGLLHLSYVINLENLNLHWVEGITDAGVAHLRKLRSLKKLDIAHSQVTDRGLAQLKQMKSLEYLGLPARGITDKGLAFLSELSSLKHLDVARVHYVDPKKDKGYYTDKGIEALSRLHLLEELNIGSIGVTDVGMSHIAKLSNLRELNIFGCPITNAGLHKLTTLKSLRRLTVSYADVTISGLRQLRALPNLNYLNVRRIKRGSSVLAISGLTKLEDLSLGFFVKSGDYFTDKDLACLSGLKRLERLQLHPRKFSDEGVAYLADMTEMKFLGIGGPDLTDEGLLHLTNMKKLFHLTIGDGQITDQGLRHLEGFKALGYLNITSKQRISAAAKRRLREKIPNLHFFQIQLKDVSPRTPQGTRPTRPKSRR